MLVNADKKKAYLALPANYSPTAHSGNQPPRKIFANFFLIAYGGIYFHGFKKSFLGLMVFQVPLQS